MSNLRLKDHTWDAANVYDSSLGKTQEQINAEVGTSLAGKQGTLVSGETIKTVNGASILGSGNIEIQGGSTGEDGYSPVVTISNITGGHRVNITDKTHPQGQNFDVMNGTNGAKGDTGDPAPASAVVPAVESWLEDNITQETGYVIDDSLTVAGAAADAKKTGDELSDLKSAKAPFIIANAAGEIANFEDGTADMPLESLKVYIEPVQADGTPTPESPLTISGRTQCSIYHSGAETSSPQTFNITFPSGAGAVYGGILDVVNNVLTVTHAYLTLNTSDMNNTENYPGWSGAGVKTIVGSGVNDSFSTILTNVSPLGVPSIGINTSTANNDKIFLNKSYFGKTQTEWQALALDIQFVIPLANPVSYPLTSQEIEILTSFGENNIWADCGPVDVQYRADTTLYLENAIDQTLSIAGKAADAKKTGDEIDELKMNEQGPLQAKLGTGTTETVYGCTFEIDKGSADAICVVPATGKTAFRDCNLLGMPINFNPIVNNERDYSTLDYYPLDDFDADNYDLCLSIEWEKRYSPPHNFIYVATKSTSNEIKIVRVSRDYTTTRRYINLFEELPEIKENKNLQVVFENMNREDPNGCRYSFSLVNKCTLDAVSKSNVGLPQYYFADGYLRERLDTILGHYNSISSDIFIWMTDPHFFYMDTLDPYNGLQSTKLIKYLINNLRVPRVFCGGDLHNGDMTTAQAKYMVCAANEVLGIIQDRLYSIVGNHEWNNAGDTDSQAPNELDIPALYNLLVKDKEDALLGISPSMSYFFDNKAQKIRYFCISCYKNASILSDTVTWFAEEMTNVPAGYTVVVLSHVGLSDADTISPNFTEIAKILDAAKTHGEYAYQSNSYDYTTFGANIACVISGHIHADYSATTSSGVHIISTACDRAANLNSGAAMKCLRKIGTIGEQAFDVVQIDTENRKVYMTRIGGSMLGALYDAENDAVVDEADYDPDTGTIAEGATRYNAAEWVRYSPYKDREFSY